MVCAQIAQIAHELVGVQNSFLMIVMATALGFTRRNMAIMRVFPDPVAAI